MAAMDVVAVNGAVRIPAGEEGIEIDCEDESPAADEYRP
jgi:hypothetical protein